MWRSRWAAVGAAVAITLGAGGLGIAQATTSTGDKPIYTAIAPCRLADTRPAPFHVGTRNTPLGADDTETFDGWGAVGNCTLPDGTTGLSLNVTAVDPSQPTFLTIYPTGAPLPTTSNLNPTPGQPPTPNAVNVALDASGRFDVFNKFGDVDVIVDVVGYYDDHDHDDIYYRKTSVDSMVTDLTTDLESQIADAADRTPTRVIWVADDGSGDFTSLSEALASITDNAAAKRYLVRMAPGAYTETGSLALKSYVDIEGSGQGLTTLSCTDCDSNGFLTAGSVVSEVRDLTISAAPASGSIRTINITFSSDELRFVDVTVTADSTTSATGVFANGSTAVFDGVTVLANGDSTNYAFYTFNSASPTVTDSRLTATGGSATDAAVFNFISTVTIRDSVLAGDDASIQNFGTSPAPIAQAANTTLDGPVTGSGTFTCVNAYDETFTALNTSCT